MKLKALLIFFILTICFDKINSQTNTLEITSEKEAKFNPYMLWRHQGTEGLAEFKKNKPHDYLKELWYYSESFYIKRNYFKEGVEMNEEMIDISRFENYRLDTKEYYLSLPGFKDAVVLLPLNKLIYKP
jgi:hypothetical protein